MLTKRHVLQSIVGLIEVNDFELLSENVILSEMADPADFDRIRAIAAMIKRFYDDFDYRESVEFCTFVEGKTRECEALYRRMAGDPKKAKVYRSRLGISVLDLPATAALQTLLPAAAADDLARLSAIVMEIRNPA